MTPEIMEASMQTIVGVSIAVIAAIAGLIVFVVKKYREVEDAVQHTQKTKVKVSDRGSDINLEKLKESHEITAGRLEELASSVQEIDKRLAGLAASGQEIDKRLADNAKQQEKNTANIGVLIDLIAELRTAQKVTTANVDSLNRSCDLVMEKLLKGK